MGIRIWTLADKEVQVAKAAFNAARARNHGCCKGPEFETYLAIFQTDMTFADIGARYGRTKQAVQQMHGKYYAFLGTGRARKAVHRRIERSLARESKLKQKLNAALAEPYFRHLRKEAGRHGKSIKPVVSFDGTPIRPGYTPVYRVGKDQFLRLHRRKKVFLPGNGTEQQYAAFQVSPNMLDGIDVYGMLIDIPGIERQLMLVRTGLLREVIEKGGKDSWTFYIPVGKYNPRRRRGTINLREYKDAWWAFDV
jgi:hypothetical protein